MEFVRSIFQSLFEDTTITTNFLKYKVFNTSCIEINKLLPTYNNTELG